MRKYKFKVYFDVGDFLRVTSNGPNQAAILAMAQRIKEAKHYSVKHVEDENGHKWVMNNQFDLKNIG